MALTVPPLYESNRSKTRKLFLKGASKGKKRLPGRMNAVWAPKRISHMSPNILEHSSVSSSTVGWAYLGGRKKETKDAPKVDASSQRRRIQASDA